MAYAPVSGLASQYDEQDGYWLKFYIPETSTPISMATDENGGTLLAKAQLDVDGFPTTDGSTIFIPFLDQSYDAYLFATAADADANNTINGIRIAQNISPFDQLLSLSVVKLRPSTTDGQTTINVPALPQNVNVILNGSMLQQSDSDYTYNYVTGNVVLTNPLGVNDIVEIQYGNLVNSTQITVESPVSIGHISTYKTTSNTDVEALLLACGDVQTVFFGGYTMNIDEDVTIPSTALAREWMLQGNAWNLTNNAQITIENDDFRVIGAGATFDGGLKVANVTTQSAATPSSVTVDNGLVFDVNDQISASWSNSYLPNSTSKIGGTNPLSDFNRVQSNTATSIVFTNQVLITLAPGYILPQGVKLFNARFDKSNLTFTGGGKITVTGISMANLANAYGINVFDTGETAEVHIEDVDIDGIALDASRFRCNSLYAVNFNIKNVLDIAKQSIVWSNETKKGKMTLINCDIEPNNIDSILYSSNTTGSSGLSYFPDISIDNCLFDGNNTNEFTPYSLYSRAISQQWMSSGHANGIAGTFHAKNSRFPNHLRAILGTSFNGKTTWTQEAATFENCEIGADGIYVESATKTVGNVRYSNCSLIAKIYELSFGCNNVTYQDSSINEDFPATGFGSESSNTTTTTYYRNQYILRTDNGNKYRCVAGGADLYTAVSGSLLSDSSLFQLVDAQLYRGTLIDTDLVGIIRIQGSDVVMHDVRFPLRETATRPVFQGPLGAGINNTVILEGIDTTDSSFLDTSRWFQVNMGAGKGQTDTPNITFKVASTDGVLTYGGQELSSREFRIKLKSERSVTATGDTSPITMTGAFLVDPGEGATVTFTRALNLWEVIDTKLVIYTGSFLAGASLITTASIGGGLVAVVGDWISLNNVGSSTVRFHEIIGVAGSDLTIRPALEAAIDATTNSQLIKHTPVY